MRLIVDTIWAQGGKRLSFTCGARETQALNSLGPVHWLYRIRYLNSSVTHAPWGTLEIHVRRT